MNRAWELPGFPRLRIRKNTWKAEEYIHHHDAVWRDELGHNMDRETEHFHEPIWELYTEPKKTKKVVQYRVTTKCPDGVYRTANWRSSEYKSPDAVHIETREIEVSE